MTDVSKFLRGAILKAADIISPLTATVTGTESKTFDDSSRPTLILNTTEGAVSLNKTRLSACVDAWGTDSDKWVDRLVKITQGETNYSGKRVPCITLQCSKKPAIERRPAPTADDDIPF